MLVVRLERATGVATLPDVLSKEKLAKGTIWVWHQNKLWKLGRMKLLPTKIEQKFWILILMRPWPDVNEAILSP